MKLIRPSALPDEVGDGYKGRLMRLNGITDEKIVNRRFSNGPGRQATSLQEISDGGSAGEGGRDGQYRIRAGSHDGAVASRSIVSVQFDRPHGHQTAGGILGRWRCGIVVRGRTSAKTVLREDFDVSRLGLLEARAPASRTVTGAASMDRRCD